MYFARFRCNKNNFKKMTCWYLCVHNTFYDNTIHNCSWIANVQLPIQRLLSAVSIMNMETIAINFIDNSKLYFDSYYIYAVI